jgi:hypothetical protein
VSLYIKSIITANEGVQHTVMRGTGGATIWQLEWNFATHIKPANLFNSCGEKIGT